MNPEPVRLLPLTPGAGNEALANALARLLVEDEAHAEMGARGALLILTGIQAFLDSNGDHLLVEQLWEPIAIARQLEKTFGTGVAARAKALEMAEAARALKNEHRTSIYEAVAEFFTEPAQPAVDKPG